MRVCERERDKGDKDTDIRKKKKERKKLGATVCPKSSDPFFYIKWVNTSWAYSI